MWAVSAAARTSSVRDRFRTLLPRAEAIHDAIALRLGDDRGTLPADPKGASNSYERLIGALRLAGQTAGAAEVQVDLTDLLAQRPEDISEAEVTRFVQGLPPRYLQLFERDAIYRHVQLARDVKPDQAAARWYERVA